MDRKVTYILEVIEMSKIKAFVRKNKAVIAACFGGAVGALGTLAIIYACGSKATMYEVSFSDLPDLVAQLADSGIGEKVSINLLIEK